MGIKLFRTPSYNVFNYQPRFYDPVKDKREARRRELRMEKGIDLEYQSKPGSLIKGSLTYRINRKHKRVNISRLRFLIILVILSLVAYLILMVDFTPLVNFLKQ
jgi:hypothetical protein